MDVAQMNKGRGMDIISHRHSELSKLTGRGHAPLSLAWLNAIIHELEYPA